MHLHRNSPAFQLNNALAAAADALKRMNDRGISRSVTAEMAAKFYNLQGLLQDLHTDMPNYRHAQCSDCAFFEKQQERLPYGDRYTSLDGYECVVRHVLMCPANTAAGFVAPDDLARTVQPFIKRQS